MAKVLKVLDGAALALTGGGLLGGALAAIDILPSPSGFVCLTAVVIGVVACVVVRMLAPVVPEHVESWFDDECRMNFPHDSLRLKTPGSDPLDSSVPGTLNWQAQQDSIAKPY